MRTCKHLRCADEVKARGVCQKHYTQLLRAASRRYVDLFVGLTHGVAVTYRHYGCRCRPCTDAATASRRAWLDVTPCPPMLHGTSDGYSNYGCRCDRCYAAECARKGRTPGTRRARTVPQAPVFTVPDGWKRVAS